MRCFAVFQLHTRGGRARTRRELLAVVAARDDQGCGDVLRIVEHSFNGMVLDVREVAAGSAAYVHRGRVFTVPLERSDAD